LDKKAPGSVPAKVPTMTGPSSVIQGLFPRRESLYRPTVRRTPRSRVPALRGICHSNAGKEKVYDSIP
jgi:hypothetical protein